HRLAFRQWPDRDAARLDVEARPLVEASGAGPQHLAVDGHRALAGARKHHALGCDGDRVAGIEDASDDLDGRGGEPPARRLDNGRLVQGQLEAERIAADMAALIAGAVAS